MTTSKTPTPQKSSQIFSWIWIALVLLAGFQSLRLSVPSAFAPDSWLHTGIGRYILEYKSVPDHADISTKITEPSLEWVSHYWLSDLILYLGTGANESLGAIAFLSSALVLTLVMLFITSLRLTLPRTVTWIMLIVGSIGVLPFWKIHPFLFLPSLMLVEVYCFVRWNQDRNIKYLIAIFGTIVLWTNVSGGFVFLPIFFLALCGFTDIITSVWISPKPIRNRLYLIRVWLITISASVASTCISPNGIRVPIYNVTVIGLLNSRDWYSTLGGALEAANSSIIKLAPSGFLYVFTLLYILFNLATLSYIFIAYKTNIRNRLIPVLPIVPFLFLPFIWIRFIPISIVATLPLFGVILTILWGQIRTRFHHPIYYKSLIVCMHCILVGWLVIEPPVLIPYSPPKEQFDFFASNALSHPLLLSTDIIGYSYWRSYPAKGYIDAQDDLYDEHNAIAIFSAYNQVEEAQIKNLLNTYHFASVMVSKENDYLTGYFSTLPDWSLVYLDYNGILFVRNDTVDETFLKNNSLHAINFSLDLGATPESITSSIRQLTQFTTRHPTSALALGQLATMYRYNNQLDMAETTLKKIPIQKWNYVVKTEMGRIKAAQGLCKQSESWFLNALEERNEQNVSRTTFDLAVLYAVCFNDTEKAKHYFKRYTSYPIPNQERERVTQLMKKFISDIDTVK